MTMPHRAILEMLVDGVALWRSADQLNFRAPPRVMDEARMRMLREHKPWLLDWLDRHGATREQPLTEHSLPPCETIGEPTINGAEAPDTSAAPLTPAQEEMLLAERLGCASAYGMPAMLQLAGELDIDALALSLDHLRERHATLRTRLIDTDAGPRQLSDLPHRAPLAVRDLSALPAHEQAAAIDALAVQWADTRFDLATGPLLRAELLVLGGAQYRLLLNLHHSIADGWSMSIMAADLTELYRARTQRIPSRLAPLTRQFGDYAWLQHVRSERGAWQRHVPFWRATLQGAPDRLTLPQDRARPPVRSFRGDEVPLHLDAATTQQLKALATRWQLTPFVLLLAAFQTVLARWAQQDDCVVGVPFANRRLPETESMIGLFVDMLPIRTRLHGQHTFETLARELKRHVDAASVHAGVPFSDLVSLSGVAHDSACPPLVPAVFVFDNTPLATLALPGLTVRQQRLKTTTSKFDLTLFMREEDGRFTGYIEYATDLFDATTMTRFAASLATLLADAAAQPEQPVHTLAIVPADDLQRLLHARHGAKLPFDASRRIHDLIEAQAAAHPERVAIHTDEGVLTYRELDERANRLAHALQARGVVPETIVGVCLVRTPTLIVALLAVFKAGGAYLPLDAAWPRERLRLMAQDCAALFTLTEPCFKAHLDGIGTLVLLDELAQESRIDDHQRAPCAATSANLAYIIYTSGSTGRPKGVAIEHRNVMALHAWAIDEYRDGELSNVIACTSICFDISIFEIFVPLMSGGAVTLAVSPLALPRAAARARILNTVPSAVAELVRQRAVPPSVDVVNVAGEPLSARLVAAIYAHTSARRVYNLYGPSEDTTYSTFARVSRDADPVPVGVPLPNTQLYVLDRHRQLVPSGVAGELYIGGSGVTRGYIGRPDLTAQRYVEHPLAPGARLYRTGDLVRFGADDQLYCLGRLDQQIKIRGFRIEIGEIEATLLAHPAVEQAVVTAREDAHGERNLAAYVSLRGAATHRQAQAGSPDAQALREHLRNTLTEAMIPADIVVLPLLPLLPNGKIDKSALPAPAVALPESAPRAGRAAPTPAASADEAAIASIWSQVLGVATPDIHTDFFELGGHSLKAARVLHLIEQRLGARLPLSALYRGATIAQLARLVGTHANTAAASEGGAVPLRAGSGAPLFVFHPAGGHLYGYAALVRQLGFEGPVYGLQRPELRGGQLIRLRSASELAALYANQIRQVQPGGVYRLLGWSFGGLMARLVAARLRDAGCEVAYIGAIDARLPPALSDADSHALAACTGLVAAEARLRLPPALLERVQAMTGLDKALQQASAADDALNARLADLYLADLWALATYAAMSGQAAPRLAAAPTHAYDASATVALDAAGHADTTLAQSPRLPRTRVFDGDHFALLHAATAATLAQWIDADLAVPVDLTAPALSS
ncbi:non-ribosomal peptide synthetase [Paraburkholderia bannensis]|uniref:non-ribosomal peptide synthetase n=1 Tax=Paraburkholderia bannensis TaxID=765414 RepID=UPI00047F7D8E|nr:non-ribosomal peptide synthetase [Paraburkholderia bannensis]